MLLSKTDKALKRSLRRNLFWNTGATFSSILCVGKPHPLGNEVVLNYHENKSLNYINENANERKRPVCPSEIRYGPLTTRRVEQYIPLNQNTLIFNQYTYWYLSQVEKLIYNLQLQETGPRCGILG